jgi:hypothetical protein
VTVQDHFGAAVCFNKDRRAPAARIEPGRCPDGLSRVTVESHDEGIDVGVAILNDEVADDNGAGGGSPGAFEGAQIARPAVLAVEGIRMQPPFAEGGDDDFALGGARRRGPTVHVMNLLGLAGPRHVLPDDFALARVDARNDALPPLISGRREKDAITPGSRGRLADSLEGSLPRD